MARILPLPSQPFVSNIRLESGMWILSAVPPPTPARRIKRPHTLLQARALSVLLPAPFCHRAGPAKESAYAGLLCFVFCASQHICKSLCQIVRGVGWIWLGDKGGGRVETLNFHQLSAGSDSYNMHLLIFFLPPSMPLHQL